MQQDRVTNLTARMYGLASLIDEGSKRRPSDCAKICAAELERLDVQQIDDPDQRQEWTPAYRARVLEIVDRAIRLSRS